MSRGDAAAQFGSLCLSCREGALQITLAFACRKLGIDQSPLGKLSVSYISGLRGLLCIDDLPYSSLSQRRPWCWRFNLRAVLRSGTCVLRRLIWTGHPRLGHNRALDLLARRLAVAVSSNDVRQTLHSAIAKRFDGDTDALWSSLAEKSDFNGRVAAVASHGRASREWAQQIASDAQKLPRLQVAVPKTFDSWDARGQSPAGWWALR